MNANMRWHHRKDWGRARARIAASRDLLAATDPGLNRLFAAVQVMTAIAVTIAVVYGFMQLTKVLWIHPPGGRALSAAQLALIAAQHHDVTLLAIAVIAWLAVLINLLLKVVVYRALDRGRLGRTARAFRARARTVMTAAAELFDAAEPRARAARRLRRRLVRLNETALVIDASLATAGALRPGVSALTRMLGYSRSSA
jgi:hypothetical protein